MAAWTKINLVGRASEPELGEKIKKEKMRRLVG